MEITSLKFLCVDNSLCLLMEITSLKFLCADNSLCLLYLEISFDGYKNLIYHFLSSGILSMLLYFI